MYLRLCSLLNLLIHASFFLVAGMWYHASVTFSDFRHVALVSDYSVLGVQQRFAFLCFSLFLAAFVRYITR